MSEKKQEQAKDESPWLLKVGETWVGKVRVKSLGYMGHKRWYPGEVFELSGEKKELVEKQFSDSWMEKLDQKADLTPSKKPPVLPGHLQGHSKAAEKLADQGADKKQVI